MKLRPDLSDETCSSGFTLENDLFKFRDLSERLTSLLTALSQGSVSLLDGRWGTGKTTFVKMWVAELKKSGIPSIYFDAFSKDYIQDPFQAVSSSFIKAASDQDKQDDPRYKSYVTRTAAVAKRLAGVTAKVGVKVATLGAIGAAELDQLSELKEDFAAAAGDISEEAVKVLLERQAADAEVFDNLRKSLRELPDLLAPDARPGDPSHPPSLIVVIDELDRCRPDFALGVLETLKHFFRMERIHFVLVTNTKHLSLAVGNRYGMSDAADEYLQKFYDFVVHFEHRYGRHDVGNIGSYIKLLIDSLLPEGATPDDRRSLTEYVTAFAIAYSLTLRQIEHILSNLVIAFFAARPREYRPAILLCTLVFLKTMRPSLFISAKSGRFLYGEFESLINDGQWGDKFDTNHLLMVFRYHSDPSIDESDPQYRGYGESLWNYNLDRLATLPYLANSVIDRFGRNVSEA